MCARYRVILCAFLALASACDDAEDPPMQIEVDARMRTVGGRDMTAPDMDPPDAAPLSGTPDRGPADDPDVAVVLCALDEERPCPGGCGVQRCDAEGNWGECDEGGAAERCNGADDDCDGTIDESFRGLGIGCSVMVEGCNAQGLIVCNPAEDGTMCQATEDVAPEAERCDGADNDCDNEVDEGFLGRLCCTEDFQCPDGPCVGGECEADLDPEPDVFPGLDPELSCDAAIELNQFGRFETNTGFAAPALDGSCGGNGPEQVYWFEFDEDTDVVLLTDGTSYDTVLHVRTDCLIAGTEVACDDDGGDGSASRIALRALAGVRYSVVLDAFSLFGGGAAQLGFWPAGAVPECVFDADCGPRMTCEEAACVPIPVVHCDEAVDVEVGVQALGNTVGEADELGAGCGTPTGGEAVYRLRLEQPGLVDATTAGSDFDTVFSVRTACIDAASEVACNDDDGGDNTSAVQFEALADTDYFLIVDGYSGASGAVVLDVSVQFDCVEDVDCGPDLRCIAGDCVLPPACEMPSPLMPGVTLGDTTGGADAYNASCGDASGSEAAYLLRLDAPQTVTLSTDGSDFDTILSVRTTCDDADAELACDDDGGDGTRSRLRFDALADTDYFVFVDGYNGASGPFALELRLPPVLTACDDAMPCAEGVCLNALCVPALACEATLAAEGAQQGDTIGAPNLRLPSCSIGSNAPDAIYVLVSPVDAEITVDTEGSQFDTVLTVLDADCDTELACNDDGGLGTTSLITFDAIAGQTYFVVVDGYQANAGAFTLTVQSN
ncbi:MAG: hypothetical protein ACI9U2_004013 [Bradymonadia bacterium]|jgi:hypothetical protein